MKRFPKATLHKYWHMKEGLSITTVTFPQSGRDNPTGPFRLEIFVPTDYSNEVKYKLHFSTTDQVPLLAIQSIAGDECQYWEGLQQYGSPRVLPRQ